MKQIKELYRQMLTFGGFLLDMEKSNMEENQFCYTLIPEKGKGYFWYYLYENMFTIQKQNFCFLEDFILESPEPEFLALQYFTSVSGEEFNPYTQLSPNSFRAYIGGDGGRTYRAVYHKDVPIRSVSISIMPDFYNRYLKEKFAGEYIDPQSAFRRITLGSDYPEFITILKQIQSYSGSGMSAKMFYEGKILEALALIMDKAKENQKHRKKIKITKTDTENLQSVVHYLDHHYAFSVSLEDLLKISFMGKTKLKTFFKDYVGCTISDYIVRKRMDHAQHLLMRPDLAISEIARAVGYERSDSFSRQFKQIMGLLPREYRNTIFKR